MTVVAGTSESKGKRQSSVDPLTVTNLTKLQSDINAANSTMEIIMMAIQKRLGRKAIVTNTKKELTDALHT